tara:strand:+ start:25 stop:219 length:195 start_codon:yes stop_codon:yes gene_type:complete
MKRIQIQAEVKVELMKWIELPDDEAEAFMSASDADIVANLDIMSDYHDQGAIELVDIVNQGDSK